VIGGIVLIAGSALLGGALALASRRRPALLELTRTFAFAAAAGVVAFHLLPEILPALGPKALLWVAGGFLLPWALEVGARTVGPGVLERHGLHGLRVAAEVAFYGLVFHSVVEGLTLLAALQGQQHAADLQIAIVAHHAPLTAAVALPFLELLGVRSAWIRVAFIGLAGAVGVVLGNLIPGLAAGSNAAVVQRATAMTAGVLLHVVSDEVRTQSFASAWQRAGDLGASLAGLALAGAGAFLALRNEPAMTRLGHATLSLSLAAAPAVLAGVACEAALARLFRRTSIRVREQLEGAFATFAVLGLAATAVRIVLVVVSAAVARRAGRSGVLPQLRADLTTRGPWLLALLFVAGAVDTLSPAGWFGHLSAPGLLVVAVALAFSAWGSASGGALLAAAVVHRGLPAALAVAFLALAPFAGRLRVRGAIASVAALAVALLTGEAIARAALVAGAERVAASAFAGENVPAARQLAAAPLAVACLVALSVLALWMMWSTGVRGWFAPLRHPELRRQNRAAPAIDPA
jgi:hypothetical protein